MQEMLAINTFVSLLQNDDGATLVEYTLVITFIALACVAAAAALGNQLSAAFSSFGSKMPTGS